MFQVKVFLPAVLDFVLEFVGQWTAAVPQMATVKNLKSATCHFASLVFSAENISMLLLHQQRCLQIELSAFDYK